MRTPKNELLGPVATLFGVGEIGSLIKSGIDATDVLDQWAAPLSLIAYVEPLPPNSLRITMRSGETWTFGISAGLYALRGSGANVVSRDDAVQKIRAALGRPMTSVLPAPAFDASSSVVAPAPDPFLLALSSARLRARTTRLPVVIHEEGPICLYVGPDDSVHFSFAYRFRRPTAATNPRKFVGTWRYEDAGTDESVALRTNGSVAGQVKLFGALPPLPLIGRWWYEAATDTITPAVQVALPPSVVPDEVGAPWIFESGIPLQPKQVGRDVIVASVVDPAGGGANDYTFHRVKKARRQASRSQQSRAKKPRRRA